MARLAKTGFVLRVGDSRSQQYAVRRDEPLLVALSTLFSTERQRFDTLLSALRECFSPLTEVRVAWIADLPERSGDTLDVFLITDANSLPELTTEVRHRTISIEQTFDVTIEIHAYTQADAPPVDWRAATLLAGVTPFEQVQQRPALHADRERRTLKLSEGLVELLDRDSSLVPRALRHVERVLGEGAGPASHDLREWRDILASYSPERLKRFLVATTPRASRLRQSSPFFAVLTPDERDRVIAPLEGQQ